MADRIRDGKPAPPSSATEDASQAAMWAARQGRARPKVRMEYNNHMRRAGEMVALLIGAMPGSPPKALGDWKARYDALKAELDSL